jgi:hypothetical protein
MAGLKGPRENLPLHKMNPAATAESSPGIQSRLGHENRLQARRACPACPGVPWERSRRGRLRIARDGLRLPLQEKACYLAETACRRLCEAASSM